MNKPLIILVNGIWSHGAGSVDRIGYKLAASGFQVLDLSLDKVGPWGARFAAKRDAKLICKHAEAHAGPVISVCHSFGCLRTATAMRMTDRISQAYMFRPAMSKNWEFKETDSVTCIHSDDDNAVKLGAVLAFHPFGRAGVVGFTSPHVRNLESVGDHNADFEPPLLDYWSNLLCTELRQRYC